MASILRRMSISRSALSHIERTAREPRQNALHQVVLSRIDQVNPKIRLLRLEIPDRGQITFLPGQWLDVHIPGLSKPGGFTITSTPREASPFPHLQSSPQPESTIKEPSVQPKLIQQFSPQLKQPSAQVELPSQPEPFHAPGASSNGYLELAIQSSPQNPPAAWLWRPEKEILGEILLLRVGGSFVWPPPGVDVEEVNRVVLVAGGVGVNPLISILSHLCVEQGAVPLSIKVLYAARPLTREMGDILFYNRIRGLISVNESAERTLDLYLTGPSLFRKGQNTGVQEGINDGEQTGAEGVSIHNRRISHEDLIEALGPVKERRGVVAYVCGPAQMTDEFVKVLQGVEGMSKERVLCEKWW
ncbi:hypothetical protein MMC30_000307 [Trapelia coarctata]|nr:hypothetical protein [Trapelia coarctata]